MEMLLLTICLFFPLSIILLLWLHGICKRQLSLQHHSRKQKCWFAIHIALSLWYLSLLTLDIVNIRYRSPSKTINILNLSYDAYISTLYSVWFIYIMTVLDHQKSTLRYDRYYGFSTPLKVTLWFFMLLLIIVLYVVQRLEPPNYIYILLCSLIVLLFTYITYALYHKPIVRLRLLIDHYIDDIVADKRKAKQYVDTLQKDQIQLLVSGWIRENIHSMYIPVDIVQLCGIYLLVPGERTDRKTSISSLLSGLFSLSMSDVSVNQLFHGHKVNRLTKDRLETALKRVFLYKVVGIAMLACVLLFCLRFIIVWESIIHMNDSVQNLCKLCMDIGMYLCIWMETFCNVLLMPPNKFIYDKCCCICKYRMNSKTIKEVDDRYNLGNLFSFSDLRTNKETCSFSPTRYYSFNNRQSLDSFEIQYSSSTRLLT